jgi:CheY-like chemotaxis protein
MILVAEDNRAFQEIARSILGNRGHDVQVVANGQEAINRLNQRAFDVVLMDVHMPVMDGLEAAAAMRNLDGVRRRVPVIAMTAHGWQCNRENCLAAGMVDYLEKPFEASELVRLVEWYGRRSHERDAPPEAVETREHDNSAADNAVSIGVSPPDFDRTSVVARLGGNEELLGRIARDFQVQAPAVLRAIQAAADRSDRQAVSILAHDLGDRAAALYQENTVAAAAAVERAAADEEAQTIRARIDDLKAVLTVLLAVLDREID